MTTARPSPKTSKTVVLLPLLGALLAVSHAAETPVIGGSCKLGSSEVQIGGKQTQFFLKCEPTADVDEGHGVWVVKSRSAAAAAAAAAAPSNPIDQTSATPTTAAPQQHHPKLVAPRSRHSNICEEDKNARETDGCAVSATCLQAHIDLPQAYLQCDQTNMRWVKKLCGDGLVFHFEQQSCIVPKRMHSLARQQQTGLVCTYSSCSASSPCSSGTCNNGYCCSSSSAPLIVSVPSNGCGSSGCGSSPQVLTIMSCPSGSTSAGACVSGSCSQGYSCNSQSNTCCSTPNPFVCPDGTQAAGGCVQGQCGGGYTCQNGLCCTAGSTTPKCLDGSTAVGACIPSCQQGQCGSSQMTYYCGTGYTCTTGNICCQVSACPNGGTLIGPSVNGQCPSGSTLQGSNCCSSTGTCPTGYTVLSGVTPVNSICPEGATNYNNAGTCCVLAPATTDPATAVGPCDANGIQGACPAGYTCSTPNDPVNGECFPAFDPNLVDAIGPSFNGACPVGYVAMTVATADPPNQCFSLSEVPGLCAETAQIGPCTNSECPQGYYCNTYADICCQVTTTALFAARLHRRPSHRPPVMSHLSQYGPLSQGKNSFHAGRGFELCADGSQPIGSCINGLCGVGFQCMNGVCCSADQNALGGAASSQNNCPDGTPAVSQCFADGQCGGELLCHKANNLCCAPSPQMQRLVNSFGNSFSKDPQPIGARCSWSQDCVGFSSGLSMCEAGTCRCSAIAYTQGIACVRRKHLMLHDAPEPAMSSNSSSSDSSDATASSSPAPEQKPVEEKKADTTAQPVVSTSSSA